MNREAQIAEAATRYINACERHESKEAYDELAALVTGVKPALSPLAAAPGAEMVREAAYCDVQPPATPGEQGEES